MGPEIIVQPVLLFLQPLMAQLLIGRHKWIFSNENMLMSIYH